MGWALVSEQWNENLSIKQKMKRLLVIIVVIAILLIIFSAKSLGMGALGKIVSNTKTGNTARDLNTDETGNMVIQFPLSYESGEYFMTFELGGSVFQGVADTGSEYIVVAGDKCSSCTAGEGVYKNTGTAQQGEPELDYGSQVDMVEWWIDDFGVSGDENVTPVTFASVTSVSGSSSLNVVGLAGTKDLPPVTPFVTELFFQQQVSPPFFYFDLKNSPKLIMGDEAPGVADNNTVPYLSNAALKSESGQDFGTDYYTVRIVSITHDGKKVANPPKYCIIDTGTTNMLLTSSLYSELVSSDAAGLEFEFENFSLSWDLAGEGLRTSIQDGQNFLGTDVFIMGNMFMKGKFWSFNLDAETVSVF